MTARQLRDWLNSLPESFLDSAEIQAGRHRPASAKRVIAYQVDDAYFGVAVNPMGEHLSDEFFKEAKILSIIGSDGEIDVDNLPAVPKSPTPRTDAALRWPQIGGSTDPYVEAKLSRQLEAELTLANERVEAKQKAYENCADDWEVIRAERDQLRKEFESIDRHTAELLPDFKTVEETVRYAEQCRASLRVQQEAMVKLRYQLRDVSKERDELNAHFEDIKEHGTDEINAAVQLRSELANALVESDNALKTLWKIGLLPSAHETIEKAALAAFRMVQHLRSELANPPSDVQQLVIQKLDLVHRDGLTKAEAERDDWKDQWTQSNFNNTKLLIQIGDLKADLKTALDWIADGECDGKEGCDLLVDPMRVKHDLKTQESLWQSTLHFSLPTTPDTGGSGTGLSGACPASRSSRA